MLMLFMSPCTFVTLKVCAAAHVIDCTVLIWREAQRMGWHMQIVAGDVVMMAWLLLPLLPQSKPSPLLLMMDTNLLYQLILVNVTSVA
jgi:hypothetical protein